MEQSQFKYTTVLILAGLILIEYLLFRTYVLRDVAPFHPINHDQTRFLSYSYEIYENLLNYGFFEGLKRSNFFSTDIRSATNLLLAPQSAIFYLFTTASRLSALTINFIYFATLQAVSYRVVSKRYNNSAFGLIFVGFLLMLGMPFFWAGGLVDFRLDFAVACIYGIFVAMVIQSNIFLNTKWSIYVTALAMYLVLMRYFVLVYLGGIFLGLLLYYLLQLMASVDVNVIQNAKIRIRNIICSGLGGALILAPIFWLSRKAIYAYYVVGHVTGIEKKIRAKEWGTEDLIASLVFYPKAFFEHHLGGLLTGLFIFFIMMLFLGLVYQKYFSHSKTNIPTNDKNTIYFIFLSIAVPSLVLLVNHQKSAVVINIISVPFVWCIFILFLRIYAIHQKIDLRMMANVFLLVGTLSFVFNFITHDPILNRGNTRDVVRMYMEMANYSQEANLSTVRLSADSVLDSSLSELLQIIPYEQKGVQVNASKTLLGDNIFEVSNKTAMDAFNSSDMFIVNPEGNYAASPYPFYESMKKIRPDLLSLAKKSWVLLGDYAYYGYHSQVYVRPSFGVRTFGGAGTIDKGLLINVPAVLLNKVKQLYMAGTCIECSASDLPLSLSANVFNTRYENRSLKSDFEIKNDHYHITVALPRDLPDNEPLIIAIQLLQGDANSGRSIHLSEPEIKTVVLSSEQGDMK